MTDKEERDPDVSLEGRTAAAETVHVFAALFWVLTYSTMSARASLTLAEPPSIVSAKRFLSITAGALVYWLVVRWLSSRRRSLSARIWRAGGAVICGLLILLIARTLVDRVMLDADVEDSLIDSARWILVWLGYFGASVAAFVAVSFRRELGILQARANTSASADREREPAEGHVWVHQNRQTLRVAVSAIEWIQAEGNYVRVHASEVEGLIRTPLSQMEEKLSDFGFVRVHRSILCRASAIRSVRREGSGALTATLESGAEVPVGRTFAATVRELVRDSQL